MPDSKNLLRNIAKRVQQGGAPFAIANRKVRPTIWPNSGMRFPAEAPSGKRDPEYWLRTGCSFRLTNPRRHSAVQLPAPAVSFTENI